MTTNRDERNEMTDFIDELAELGTKDLVDLAWPAYRDLGVTKFMLAGEPRINLIRAIVELEEEMTNAKTCIGGHWPIEEYGERCPSCVVDESFENYIEASLDFLSDDPTNASYLPVSLRASGQSNWGDLYDNEVVTPSEVAQAAAFKMKELS